MKNVSRHVGTLTIVTRLPSSRNGNPRYLVQVNGVTCRTPVDSPLGYSITNFEGKQVTATIGTYRELPTLNTIELVKP